MINGNLISGVHYDYANNPYLIPQTMAGVEIDVDSDEFQEWYRAFTRSHHKQSRKPSTRSIRLFAKMSRAEIEQIARNRGTTMVLSVGGI